MHACMYLHFLQRLPWISQTILDNEHQLVIRLHTLNNIQHNSGIRSATQRLRVRPVTTLDSLVVQWTARVKQLADKRCCQLEGSSMGAAYWRWTCTAFDPGHQRDSAESASNKTVHRSPRVPKGQREGETTWVRVLKLPPALQKIKGTSVDTKTSSSIQMFVDQILHDNITIFSHKHTPYTHTSA